MLSLRQKKMCTPTSFKFLMGNFYQNNLVAKKGFNDLCLIIFMLKFGTK